MPIQCRAEVRNDKDLKSFAHQNAAFIYTLWRATSYQHGWRVWNTKTVIKFATLLFLFT